MRYATACVFTLRFEQLVTSLSRFGANDYINALLLCVRPIAYLIISRFAHAHRAYQSSHLTALALH